MNKFIIISIIIIIIGGGVLWLTTQERLNEKQDQFTISWNCGDPFEDSRDGQVYSTVQIGDQCWMVENLNVGTMISGGSDQGTDCVNIEKYCYNNDPDNCDVYGGLYQWNQAMCGETIEGTQGICPDGWHIPTDDEWATLEYHVCVDVIGKPVIECDSSFEFRGYDFRGLPGKALKSGGQTGFEALLAGGCGQIEGREEEFGSQGESACFWASLFKDFEVMGVRIDGPIIWCVHVFEETLYRPWDTSRTITGLGAGYSVRCIKSNN